MRETGFDPWGGKIPWRRAWQPTPVFLFFKFKYLLEVYFGFSKWTFTSVNNRILASAPTPNSLQVFLIHWLELPFVVV